MNEIECESCIKRKTIYCPSSSECYDTVDKPYYQNRIMLLKENQQLKEQLEASERTKKEAIDYINFLVIIDTQLAGGRFKDTIWGEELLEILDIDKGE